MVDTAYLPAAAGCAIEWLMASGPRTEERLHSLCEHFAAQYREDADAMFRAARDRVAQHLEPA
jgi:hypothetical protein